MKKIILLIVCVVFIVWAVDWLGKNESQNSSSDLARAQAALKYAEAAKAQADAVKTAQESAEIAQRIRRQNEMDDGIAVNVGARVITNEGITPAERIGTVLSNVLFVMCVLPWLVLLALYVFWRKLSPTQS